MMRIDALSPWRELQRWHRSVCEDHLWCRNKYEYCIFIYVCILFGKVLMWTLWKEKIDLWRRQIIEEEKGGGGGRVISRVGVTMTWPDHLGKTHTRRMRVPHRLLRWLTVPPMATFPDTYGGNLAALHQHQLPDRGTVSWTCSRPNFEKEQTRISPHIVAFIRLPK